MCYEGLKIAFICLVLGLIIGLAINLHDGQPRGLSESLPQGAVVTQYLGNEWYLVEYHGSRYFCCWKPGMIPSLSPANL